MKKICYILALLFCVCALCLPCAAADSGYVPPFEVNAQAVYLYNLDTDTVIFARNADKRMYPASLTKIMTAIVAMEDIPDLDGTMLQYPNYIQDYLYNYQREVGSISLGGLLAGEELSMRKYLYALLLPSANEAAMIIADHVGGSQEGFAAKMNSRAKELGAKDTNFVNANGLYADEHYTTAYDIAQIALHAINIPGFMDIVTTTGYESGPTNKHDNLVWNTTNLMMLPTSSYYYPSLRGIKTGTLPQSGRCFVSTASRDGFTYLLVLMGCTYLDAAGVPISSRMEFEDTARLYDWVFDTFRQKTLMEKDKAVAEIPLRMSMDRDYLQLITGERLAALIPQDTELTDVTLEAEIPEYIDAPVYKYDPVGEARVMLAGEEMGRVPLLAGENVAASPMLVMWENMKGITHAFWFKFAVSFAVLLLVLYIVLMILRNRNRRRYGGYRPRRRM